MSFKLGTRGSPLALAQANMTAAALRAAHGWAEAETEIVILNTQGDRVLDRPLAELGGKALWTKELDAALPEPTSLPAAADASEPSADAPAGGSEQASGASLGSAAAAAAEAADGSAGGASG